MAKKKSPKTSPTPRLDAFDAAYQRFLPLVLQEEQAAFNDSISRPLLPAFRLNLQKTTPESIQDLADRANWKMEPVPFCPDGRRIQINGTITPGQTAEHRAGHYYIQDSASMLPVMLFDQELLQGESLILDMAASPGGKTTHLAARAGKNAFLFANDSSRSRLTALKQVTGMWGIPNHAITNFPGELFGQMMPNRFDAILLDAPCSMQSLVSIESHPLRPITNREEEALSQRQTALLTSAIHALKPGGQVVYSTCTLSPLENESVIQQMLDLFGDTITIENAHSRLPYPAQGITEWEERHFSPELRKTVRLWHHRYQTAGFYAALIRKNAPTSPSSETDLPFRDFGKTGFIPIQTKAAETLKNNLTCSLGFDLSHWLEETRVTLWQRGDELRALPHQLTSQFLSLPCSTAGMRIGTFSGEKFFPDFDWISLIFNQIQAEKMTLDGNEYAAWLRKEDLRIDIPQKEKGSILVLIDPFGVFLGCGIIGNGRIRNLNK